MTMREYPAKDGRGKYMPYDLSQPAVKLARRVQALMGKADEKTVIPLEVRQFEGEWYLSVAHGKWEKLSDKH